MNLFISCKHIFGLDNLYIGELGSRVEGRLGATSLTRDFRLKVFFMNQFPRGP
jgi:hypothetical protein